MGLLFPALPHAEPRRQSLSFLGAAGVHAALIGLLFAAGAPRQLAQMVEPIAVRLIELAPEAPSPPREPPREIPPPPRAAPVRPATPPPVLTRAVPAAEAIFAVPPAPTFSPPEAAPTPAPIVAAAPAEPVLTAARFDAAYLANPKPGYPPASRRLGEEGRVVLRVHVGAGGQAEAVDIKQSSGFARLDTAARDAVARWRFVPARKGDLPVAAWVLVPVVFNLES